MGTASNTGNSMNELVFENRNKNYGAYRIRQSYDDSVVKSFTIAMLVLLGLIATYRLMPDKKVVVEIPPATTPDQLHVTAMKIEPKHPVEVQHTSCAKPPKTDHLPPTFVDSTAQRPKADSTREPEPEAPGLANGTGHTPDGPTTEGPGPGTHEPEAPEIIGAGQADVNPEFPGGEKKMLAYLSENIHYPSGAAYRNISGRVTLLFVVAPDGSISQVSAVKKIGGGCEEEAMRVVSKMPRWKPGSVKGHPVPVYFYLPVTFTLQ